MKKKKGLLATIWESMTKTGGCCGSGESCGGSPKEKSPHERELEKKIAKEIIEFNKKR